MPNVCRSALVAFSADRMFDLVNNVGAYPEFLPGCAQSEVLSSTTSKMKASLLIAKAGVRQWFTTENSLTPGKAIDMQLLDGPFSHLSGGWTFTALSEDACKVELNLHFEFSSKLASIAFGKVFNGIATNMVNAFIERAKQVYA